MAGQAGVTGQISATTIYTNTESFPLMVNIAVYITMASTNVAITGILTGTVRWTDARSRSRSISIPSISLLDSSSRASFEQWLDVKDGTDVTFETATLNLGLGSFSYDWCSSNYPYDAFPT